MYLTNILKVTFHPGTSKTRSCKHPLAKFPVSIIPRLTKIILHATYMYLYVDSLIYSSLKLLHINNKYYLYIYYFSCIIITGRDFLSCY